MDTDRKYVLITGSNRGIGKQLALGLANNSTKIIMACRDLESAFKTREDIIRTSKNVEIDVLQLDLASLSKIRSFADEIRSKYGRLDVLINNAGTFNWSRRETEDGFELTMGTNYFGPFLLTNLLLPLLNKNIHSRIINVGSAAYKMGKLVLDDLHFEKQRYKSFKAYATSKLAIMFFTFQLAEDLRKTGVTVNTFHPGHVATDIWPKDSWYLSIMSKFIKLFAISPQDAAKTGIYLAQSSEVADITGRYFEKCKMKEVSSICQNIDLQKRLWQISEQQTGLHRE